MNRPFQQTRAFQALRQKAQCYAMDYRGWRPLPDEFRYEFGPIGENTDFIFPIHLRWMKQ